MVVDMKRVWHYERECDRGAGCGKTARPDLSGIIVWKEPEETALLSSLVIGYHKVHTLFLCSKEAYDSYIDYWNGKVDEL